jgi:hypothetical protein
LYLTRWAQQGSNLWPLARKGATQLSPDVAWCRPKCELVGLIVARHRPVSFDVCLRWLPVWLPRNLISTPNNRRLALWPSRPARLRLRGQRAFGLPSAGARHDRPGPDRRDPADREPDGQGRRRPAWRSLVFLCRTGRCRPRLRHAGAAELGPAGRLDLLRRLRRGRTDHAAGPPLSGHVPGRGRDHRRREGDARGPGVRPRNAARRLPALGSPLCARAGRRGMC